MEKKIGIDRNFALKFQRSCGFAHGKAGTPPSIWNKELVSNELKKAYEEAYDQGINSSKVDLSSDE